MTAMSFISDPQRGQVSGTGHIPVPCAVIPLYARRKKG